MYDFHYSHMKIKYPRANQLQLLFTDTDNLAYAVQTDDIYKDIVTLLKCYISEISKKILSTHYTS